MGGRCRRHSLLVTGHQLFARQTKYKDFGGSYLDERSYGIVKRQAVKCIEKFGGQAHLVFAGVPTE